MFDLKRIALNKLPGGFSKRKISRYILPATNLGFVLLWLLLAAFLWSQAIHEQEQIELALQQEAQAALSVKANEISHILDQSYHMVRTISLLPGIRLSPPGNRANDEIDIVSEGRMSQADYDTIQQLYNHLASQVSVSEVYVVYDGFDPEAGQVPFVMFDQVIVDRYTELLRTESSNHNDDFPEEDEAEEYRDYVRQLDYLRHNSFEMPGHQLDQILPINSGIMRTCDNSQYLSKADGDERHTYGFTISVPIYALDSRQFKGLVTAVIRTNVLEAKLLGWPVLPVTDADKRLLDSTPDIDLNAAPVNYLIEDRASGIQIYDQRITDIESAMQSAAYHFETALSFGGNNDWKLHHFVPRSAVELATSFTLQRSLIQLAIISLFLALLWFVICSIFKSQRKSSLQLRELADVDSLTGLPNRRMIGLYMNAILKSTASNQYFSVIMVDLDDFKQVNDSLGHEAGDRMLIEVANRFNKVLRIDDHVMRFGSATQDIDITDITFSRAESILGRLGGDEFLVILGNLSDRNQAVDVAGRLLDSLRSPIEIGIERIYAHVSMGISVFPDDGLESADLLSNADIALYEAKRRGRDQAVMFEPELNVDAMRRLKMIAALHEALIEDQFFLVYQPELFLESGRINAAEALLRWQHPEFGLVTPFEFIPLLERSGLIVDVGQWVLRTACLQFKQWAQSGIAMTSISVNISPKQLLQPDFATMIEELLIETDVKPEELVLEVTESMFIENTEIAFKSLASVRYLGVRVAIDDFGTGYSSLSYLQKMPLDILKIDRSFVSQTHTDYGIAICDMLIQLSARLGLEVVAEGIETEQQLNHLKGADWIQGYLIAKPLPADEFLEKAQEYLWVEARKLG